MTGDQAKATRADQTRANVGRPPQEAKAGLQPRGGEETGQRAAGTSAHPSGPCSHPSRAHTPARPPRLTRPGGQRRTPGPARPAARRTPRAAPSSLAAASSGPGAARHHPRRRAGSSVWLRGARARTRGHCGSRRRDTGQSGSSSRGFRVG